MELPRGRDYQGGDLIGLDRKLDHLKALGVTAVYLNPIFDAGSNHSYDTQDYTKVDPYFGTQKDFDTLVDHASQKGIRIILDGVFNHMSSDSPFFDRYRHYATVGACESASSPYRSWFTFRKPTADEPQDVCAPSTPGGEDTYYDGWFGFDSIPVLTKSDADRAEVLPHRPGLDRQALAAAGSRRLADGRDGRRVVPGRLLGVLPRRGEEHRARRTDHQRDVAEGLHAAADAAGRPGRHHDELPPAGRRPRVPDARRVRQQGLRGQRPSDQPDRVRQPDRLHRRGLSGRALLHSDEPPGQPRHRAARLDIDPGAENRTDKEQTAANVLAGKRSVQLASLLQLLDARRADRVLRRRGRHDRRRRPRRPPALPVGGPGRLARPGDAGPLHGPGQASPGRPRAALRGPADPPRRRRRGDCGDRAGDGQRCGGLRRQPK